MSGQVQIEIHFTKSIILENIFWHINTKMSIYCFIYMEIWRVFYFLPILFFMIMNIHTYTLNIIVQGDSIEICIIEIYKKIGGTNKLSYGYIRSQTLRGVRILQNVPECTYQDLSHSVYYIFIRRHDTHTYFLSHSKQFPQMMDDGKGYDSCELSKQNIYQEGIVMYHRWKNIFMSIVI